MFLGKWFNSLKLIVNVGFSHPPGPDWAGANDSATIRPLRLLFTDQTKGLAPSHVFTIPESEFVS